MKTVEFSQNSGKAFGDYEAMDAAKEFLKHPEVDRITTKTENFIYAVRVLIHDKRFPHNQVQFVFNGEFLVHDAEGRIAHWPVGFCGFTEDCLDRLLDKAPETFLPL